MEEGLRKELVAWEAGKRKISIIQKSVSVKNRRQEYPDKEGRAPKRRKFPSSRMGVRKSKHVGGRNWGTVMDHP